MKTIRAEFLVPPGQRNFNPVNALRGLLQAMQQADSSASIFNKKTSEYIRLPSEIPEDDHLFGQLFPVHPHIRRQGGGTVHVHFHLPETIDLSTLKTIPSLLTYLKYHRIWLTPHQFETGIVTTIGYVFMKSPALTHHPTYIESLKKLLSHNESSTASTTPASQTTENSSSKSDKDQSEKRIKPADNSPEWKTESDVPHMEVARRTLTIRPTKDQPDAKPIPVFLLEIKSSQTHTQILREALLKAPLNSRGHGIFIPPSFLTAEPQAVYNLSLIHI